MDLLMSVAASGLDMKQTQLMHEVGLRMLDKSMELETQTELNMISQMLPPTSNLLDTYA
ncbi:MAG: hypothetical protein LBH21_04510 [Gracilibacteraceae bacterium]|jgi:hypothetical protein|nr:hypothetical protein [Gracilibacteraceae bacterium]